MLQEAIVDMQGFDVPHFEVREFVLLDKNGTSTVHEHLKGEVSKEVLLPKERQSVLFMENSHHKILFNGGWHEQSDGQLIIKSVVQEYDIIYVKGNQKKKLLINLLEGTKEQLRIIDIGDPSEKYKNIPKFEQTDVPCEIHRGKPAMCAHYNCVVLYNYLP